MASEVGVLAMGADFDVRLAEADKPLDAPGRARKLAP
jgi:hypothetical protein